MLLNYTKYLTALVCFLVSFQSAAQESLLETTIAREDVQHDLALLKGVLEESHPGFHYYTSQTTMDSLFVSAVPESDLTYLQSYSMMAELIDRIHDGHTNLYLNDNVTKYILDTQRFFPFTLSFLEGGSYVNHNFSEHEHLKRGCEIIAVNGMAMEEIIAELLPFITCDGVPREAELYQLEGQFWWFYAMRFGFKSTFRIEYKEAENRLAQKSKTLLVSAIRYNDRFDLLNEVYGFNQTELRPPIDFEVSDNVAVLTINQFYGIRKSKYIHFLDYCFAEIDRLNIKSLIIDVRENGGGREGYENLLLSHLDNSLDQKYATVKMTSANSSYYKYMKHPVQNRIKDWVYKTFEFEDVDGDLVRRDRFKSTLDPQKNIFYGDVYVLIGGEVFSGGSDFASLAKSYARNCTLIGTETLGGAVANSSGYFYRVELPNTGMVIEVPRVLFELNVADQKLGHGVLPDIEVTPPIESFVDSRDPAMEEAYQLILEKQELARLK